MSRRRSTTARVGGGTLFTIAIVNFLAFAILSLMWGGDALNGRVENERYYLSHEGRLTEVSEGRWRFSRYHAISLFVTHPLGIVGGLWAFGCKGRE